MDTKQSQSLNRRTMMHMTAFTAAIVLPLPAMAGDRIAKVNGNAIKGYDTTAYFRHGTPRKGTSSSVVKWKGATWRFETDEEAALFRADPEYYSPQFGGYCARAMSLGRVFKGDPEVWRIRGDKLYLFARPVGRDFFDKGPDEMIKKAEANWEKLK